jgi:hypothetical protein
MSEEKIKNGFTQKFSTLTEHSMLLNTIFQLLFSIYAFLRKDENIMKILLCLFQCLEEVVT